MSLGLADDLGLKRGLGTTSDDPRLELELLVVLLVCSSTSTDDLGLKRGLSTTSTCFSRSTTLSMSSACSRTLPSSLSLSFRSFHAAAPNTKTTKRTTMDMIRSDIDMEPMRGNAPSSVLMGSVVVVVLVEEVEVVVEVVVVEVELVAVVVVEVELV